MNFGSHTDRVVEAAVSLVNVATPGMRRGRVYSVPTGDELLRRVREALGTGVSGRRPAPSLSPEQAERLAETGRRLRSVFVNVDENGVDTAAHTVNGLLAELKPMPYLERHDGQPWHLHFHTDGGDLPTNWASGCTVGLATVLGSGYANRLGVCSAEHCDRVYVDVSRNGTKKFCSIACQNRVKAAAHRARAHQPRPTS